MPGTRPVRPELARLLNKYGGGRVHMGLFPVGPLPPPVVSVEARRRIRRELMGARLMARRVQGILSAPTLVLAGTGGDFQAIDGLDLTLEHDSDIVMVDFQAVISMSGSPAIVHFAVNVDNSVDMTQTVDVTSVATAALLFSGSFALSIGPGTHRYRLYMTTDNAVTATFTGRQRSLRVASLLGLF
jgi:hypothetical protein